MPRIDPLQLLNCLQVLLSPSGGILSKDEVQRLASLMTKFSKKLVSKCVYVLILKNTERTLLGEFMTAGGWTLIQLWLHDAMYTMNWALVKELLELLLITPVDVERLKSNNIPKLVKSLSKREDLDGVHELSTQLVQQWLKIVKDETQSDVVSHQQRQLQTVVSVASVGQLVEIPVIQVAQAVDDTNTEANEVEAGISTQTFYKLTLKDGKHLISKVSPTEANCTVVENVELVQVEHPEDTSVLGIKEKDDKKKSHEKSSSSSGKHKSSSSSKSSSNRDKDRNSSSSSHSKSKDRHSSSSSSRDKDRNKDKDRHRHRSNGSVKSSSSSSSKSSKDKEKDRKDNKEKQAERDKDTLSKIQPHSLQKLPKIPKKSSEDKSKEGKELNQKEPKKGTISIEVRKSNEERPKTVKVYKSKMRSTGLEEEAKPAPPRPVKKSTPTTPALPPTTAPIKRPSPIRDVNVAPPEKKSKTEPAPLEKPGSIKLIPPKPKPAFLQESDMFMDALAASATTKKEPKKRKRRASVSKDSTGGSSPPTSPSATAAGGGNVPSSAIALKNMAPPKFYQDTLETDESKQEDNSENGETRESEEDTKNVDASNKEETERSTTPMEDFEDSEKENASSRDNNELKGVLVYTRRKGPKKSIKWKPDEELVEIQYFELDETERVNVTKTFGDMAKQDVRGEREALQMSRKLPNEDVMDVQTVWRIPTEIDLIPSLAEPGCKSFEKDIQFAREKSVLQALYFSKKMLPDSPGEPDPENYQIKDPIMIPIEDGENPDHDFRNTPWPEPKGSPPRQNLPNNVPPVFQNPPNPFQNFGIGPPGGFQNMPPNMQPFGNPGFVPPNVLNAGGGAAGGGGEWNNMPPNMHNPQMMPPNMGPPEMMNQGSGPINPNMFMPPPDNFNPMMNENNHRFPGPFNQQGPGMFPPHQNNFNANRGGHFRRGSWVRMNGPGPGGWNNMRGGGGGGGAGGGGGPHRGGGRICNNFRMKGFCRNRDNCPYFHPNN